MEQELCAAMSRRANENVGRVLYDGDCVGSCASVLLCLSPALGTTAMYILTCRHVVFDEDEGGILMYDLAFNFTGRTYSEACGNLEYVGSSDPEHDLSFFKVIGEDYPLHGFSILDGLDVYQGQSIVVAGFPIAIDQEGILTSSTKHLAGIISAVDAIEVIALADISASMPNMSGGAVLSKGGEFKYLLGLHMGVCWHEERAHKIKGAEPSGASQELLSENAIAVEQLYLVQDKTVLIKPIKPAVDENEQSIASPCKEAIPAIDALSVVESPPENTRSRGLYAMENIPQKGSMAYFVPKRTIAKYLQTLCKTKRPSKSSHTTQRSKSVRKVVTR